MRAVFCFLMLFLSSPLTAQVEIFRPQQDTAVYIAPEDTITKPPVFGNGDIDFFRFIETRYNLGNSALALDYAGEVVRFSFYVHKDGHVSDYTLLYGSNAIVNSEIERIVSNMPVWEPGYQNGRKKKTLMVYNLLIRKVEDFPPVQVTMKESSAEYTDKTKQIKWFIVAGTLMILVTLWITSSIK